MTDTIAIDFGTSRTKVAYWNPDWRRPDLMRFHGDVPYAPSLFYLFRDSERILWGHEAEEMLKEDPAGVVDVLKRSLHERYVYANRRKVSPRQLLVLLLYNLRAQAGGEVAAFRGTAPENVFLSAPVLYGPTVRKLLCEAAMEASFAEVKLVDEPVAAARAWLAETGDRLQEVVVLDCGGGTLDWAYLRYQDGEFRVVLECPPHGNVHVGGHDVDLELLERVKQHAKEPVGDEAVDEIEQRQVLYLQEVRDLKERYCRGLPLHPLKLGGRKVSLTEREIQSALDERFIQHTCEDLKRYLDKVREVNEANQPTVLLVGGSARIKGLREAIEAQCGCQTVWWERSEYATALGAVPIPPQAKPQPHHPDTPAVSAAQQYRRAVEMVWLYKRLDEAEVEQLTTLAREPGLNREQAADLEREVIGKTKEALRERPAGQRRIPGTVFRDTLKDRSYGPEMVVIPAGTFRMGNFQGIGDQSIGDHSEKPVHTVSIAQPFALGKYPATFEEYDRFARATGREQPNDWGWGRGNRPVINVSWQEAVAYAEWLSAQTGKGYRLPSEAEWEYAARAGTSTVYWWGDEVGRNRANCNGCGSQGYNKQTAPVGSFAPNPFGLYDMLGNVWEWVQDCWNEGYHRAPSDESAWLLGDCALRVIRGGSWYHEPRYMRASYRYRVWPGNRLDTLGFRLARDL